MDKFEGISEEQKQKIVEALNKRGVNMPCPRCKHEEFSLIEGYFAHVIQNNLNNLVVTGLPVPTAIVVCKNCGFLSEHALGALGLLPINEDVDLPKQANE